MYCGLGAAGETLGALRHPTGQTPTAGLGCRSLCAESVAVVYSEDARFVAMPRFAPPDLHVTGCFACVLAARFFEKANGAGCAVAARRCAF